MWKTSNTETVTASPSEVWKLWQNVTAWPKQDSSITSASIDGPFAVGSKITLKPKGSPTVKVVIKKMEVNKGYTTEGKLPLAKLQFVHQITTKGKQTSFTQSVIISGPLSGLFARMMGKSMSKNLNARMKTMATMLQK
jgi:hypothetical protein